MLLSPLCYCHHSVIVITVLLLNFVTVTTVFLSTPCYCNHSLAVTTLLLSPLCYCHHCVVTTVLLSQPCYCHNRVTVELCYCHDSVAATTACLTLLPPVKQNAQLLLITLRLEADTVNWSDVTRYFYAVVLFLSFFLTRSFKFRKLGVSAVIP